MKRIAIDLHGTYDNDVQYFNDLITSFKIGDPVKFYILSGSPVEDIKTQLLTIPRNINSNYFFKATEDDHSIELTKCDYTDQLKNKICVSEETIHLLSIVDFCKLYNIPLTGRLNPKTNKISFYVDGPEEIWWSLKSIICNLHDINMLIDDKLQYSSYFGLIHKTSFIHWTNISGKYPDIKKLISCCR